MPKGLPRSFSTFLRSRVGAKGATDDAANERLAIVESQSESSLNTTLDRVETTLDRMGRSLFAVDTVPKAVARARANQMAQAAGLRDVDRSDSRAETAPPLARSITSRTSALARAAEELRMLELRVHEANAFTSEDYDGDSDGESGSGVDFEVGAAHDQHDALVHHRGADIAPSEPPLLVDVVSLGPNVIALEPVLPVTPEPAPVAAAVSARSNIVEPSSGAPAAELAPIAPISRNDTPAEPTATQVAPVSIAPGASTLHSLPAASAARADARVATPPARPAPRPRVQDEISLEVADDIDSDQLCQFLGVLPELMESILLSTDSYTSSPHARDEGVRARNALRQLELAAESVGIRGIANFASHATALLDALLNTTATIPGEMFVTLRDSISCLNHMSDVVWGKTTLAPEVPEQLEALIETELRAILDLTLRVEEPSYSVSLDPRPDQERSAPAASRHDPLHSSRELPTRSA